MRQLVALVALAFVVRVAAAQGVIAQDSPSRAMAATVIKMWLLDGMAAEWHSTPDGDDLSTAGLLLMNM